jgi:hypothetical protein
LILLFFPFFRPCKYVKSVTKFFIENNLRKNQRQKPDWIGICLDAFGCVWIAFGCVWMLFGWLWIYFGLLWMRLDNTRAIVQANQQPILAFEVERWKLNSPPPRRRGLEVFFRFFARVIREIRG